MQMLCDISMHLSHQKQVLAVDSDVLTLKWRRHNVIGVISFVIAHWVGVSFASCLHSMCTAGDGMARCGRCDTGEMHLMKN